MKRLRLLLPLLNLVVFGIIAVEFVSRHGGWQGDFPGYDVQMDAVTAEPSARGAVLFNRWLFPIDREPLFKAFMFLNLPAFFLARFLLWDLMAPLSEGFQSAYPFGIGQATYSLMIALVFSLVQWFSIGTLIERFRSRTRRNA